MEYLIGLIMAAIVARIATIVGFDRERAFYPTVLIVIASYYVLFAVMGASSGRILLVEIILAGIFSLFAVLGFKRNLWIVVAALIGHGVFDFVHQLWIDNPGVPHWWPGFCLAFDVTIAACLGVLLLLRRSSRLT